MFSDILLDCFPHNFANDGFLRFFRESFQNFTNQLLNIFRLDILRSVFLWIFSRIIVEEVGNSFRNDWFGASSWIFLSPDYSLDPFHDEWQVFLWILGRIILRMTPNVSLHSFPDQPFNNAFFRFFWKVPQDLSNQSLDIFWCYILGSIFLWFLLFWPIIEELNRFFRQFWLFSLWFLDMSKNKLHNVREVVSRTITWLLGMLCDIFLNGFGNNRSDRSWILARLALEIFRDFANNFVYIVWVKTLRSILLRFHNVVRLDDLNDRPTRSWSRAIIAWVFGALSYLTNSFDDVRHEVFWVFGGFWILFDVLSNSSLDCSSHRRLVGSPWQAAQDCPNESSNIFWINSLWSIFLRFIVLETVKNIPWDGSRPWRRSRSRWGTSWLNLRAWLRPHLCHHHQTWQHA